MTKRLVFPERIAAVLRYAKNFAYRRRWIDAEGVSVRRSGNTSAFKTPESASWMLGDCAFVWREYAAPSKS